MFKHKIINLSILLSMCAFPNVLNAQINTMSHEPFGKNVKITKFKKDFNSRLPFTLVRKEQGKLVFQATSVYGGITREIITSSQNWTVPSSSTKVKVFLIGGGGGGATQPSATQGGNGGGAGQYAEAEVVVTPGSIIALTVGAGGAVGNNGGITKFGSSLEAWYTYANGGVSGCGGIGSFGISNSCGENGARAYSTASPVGISTGGRGGYNGYPATMARKSLLGRCVNLDSYCMYNGGFLLVPSLGGKPGDGYFGAGGVGGQGGTISGIPPTTGTGFGAGGVGLPSYTSVANQNLFTTAGNPAIGGGGEGGFVGPTLLSVSGMSTVGVANTRPNTAYAHTSYVNPTTGYVVNGYYDGASNGATNTTGIDGVIIIEY